MPNFLTEGGMEIRVLASGSGGNSILISSKETKILVDAGLTCKELSRRLMLVDCTLDDVSAAIITHEHQDHVRGVGVISRKHGLPIFMNEGHKKTYAELDVYEKNKVSHRGKAIESFIEDLPRIL